MNELDGIVGVQVDALMDLLEKSRDAHCAQIHEQAELQAAEIRRRARRLARERVSAAAHEERARLEREIRMVEAEIETEQRKRARARDMALIEAGRGRLADALTARWKARTERERWAQSAVLEAGEVLLGREWTLEHPPHWPAEERDRAIEFARERCGATVTVKAVGELDVGLRIRSAGALVDMSIPGLLANARTVDGELLADFNRVAEGEAS
ncbi:MAG TPA: hypothetical protein VMQ83_11455 [Gammaproteobacteria bacterium]|nr:hypothetical protein [Gammaproteobacteria bacterium]